MVQKKHPRVVIWVPSSHHPVVFLAPLNSPMRRPFIKKSVHYATLDHTKVQGLQEGTKIQIEGMKLKLLGTCPFFLVMLYG